MNLSLTNKQHNGLQGLQQQMPEFDDLMQLHKYQFACMCMS